MFATSTLLLALLGTTSAHMEVQFPPPLNSKYNPNTPSAQIDYNMVSPLKADGSDFPCKGYQSLLGTPAGAPTASFAIGSKGNMTITGGANHGGGSCQISLSMDGAKTFTVIQSIEGGCPTSGTSNLDFTIPPDAPAGTAVMAWTWHNQIGNREMYMNCAAVTLTGGGGSAKRKNRRAAAFASRPGIYIANVGAAGGGCTTKESTDVVYPSPGPDVVDQSQKPETPDCGVTQKLSAGSGTGSGTGTGTGSGSAPASPSSPSSVSGGGGGVFAPGGQTAPSEAPSAPVQVTPATPTTITTVTSTPTPSTASSPGSNAGAAPGSGSGSNSGSGSGAAAAAPAPAPSTPTNAGSGSDSASSTPNEPGSTCTEEGAYACLTGGTSFQRCASGVWSVVQATAPGTTCSGGTSTQMNMVAIAL